jgi:hypothetical protein
VESGVPDTPGDHRGHHFHPRESELTLKRQATGDNGSDKRQATSDNEGDRRQSVDRDIVRFYV